MEAARSWRNARSGTPLPGGKNAWDHIYNLCLSRNPTPDESRLFRRFLVRQRAILQAEPESVKQLANGAGSDLEPLLAATWTAAARAVLNLDEFITRE